MGATRTKVNLVLSIVSFVFLLGGYFTDYWLSVGGILDMHSGLHKACFFGICIKMSTILDSLEESDSARVLMNVALYSGGVALALHAVGLAVQIWDVTEKKKGKACGAFLFLFSAECLSVLCLLSYVGANSDSLEYAAWSFFLYVVGCILNPWLLACCECGSRNNEIQDGEVINEPV